MTSLSSHLKLTNLFKAIADGEKHAEISRQILAERHSFEPFTVFTRLDRDADGFLSVQELLDFFHDNNDTDVTREDMLAFIMNNSVTNSEKLTYSDFLSLVLPKSDYKTRQTCIERPTFHIPGNEVLPFELEVALMKLLKKEVQLTRKLEVLKEDLVSNQDFSLREAFYAFNQGELRCVDFDCIKAFFKHHCIFITDDDILNILNRTDADNDRVLNYKGFAKIVLPIHIYAKHFDELCESKDNILQNFISPKKSAVKIDRYSSPYTTSTQATPPPQRYSSRDVVGVTSERKSGIIKSVQERATIRSFYSDSKMVRHDLSYTEKKEKQNNQDEEGVLIVALQKYIALDKELARWKNQLSMRKDFNLFDSFRLFDKEEKGYMSEAELKKGLREIGLHASYEEVGLLVSKYNKVDDDRKELRYGDFCDMLTPNDESYAELLKKRRPTYAEQKELSQIISAETKDTLRRTLQALLVNELYSENLRQQLSRKSLDKVWNAFKTANKGQKETVGLEEFQDLLSKHGVSSSIKELASIVGKFDKTGCGQITYEEFAEGMKPKSPMKHY